MAHTSCTPAVQACDQHMASEVRDPGKALSLLQAAVQFNLLTHIETCLATIVMRCVC